MKKIRASKEAGFSATHLKAAGVSKTDRQTAGVSATQLKAAGLERPIWQQQASARGALSETKGFSGIDPNAAGFNATHLVSMEDPIAAGSGTTDLKDAGCSLGDPKATCASTIDLKAAISEQAI